MTRNSTIAALCLALLTTAGILLGGHSTGRIFPVTQTAFCSGVVGLTLLAIFSDLPEKSAAVAAVLIGGSYRLFVYFFSPTMQGVDPDTYAIWTHNIVAGGSLDVIPSSFYQSAPLFFVESATVSMVAGVSAKGGLVYIPLVTTVLLPTFAIQIGRRFGLRHKFRAVFAIVSVALPLTIRRSIWPIPQTYGFLLWLLFLGFFALYLRQDGRHRHFLVLGVAAIAILLSHKLPLLLIFGLVVLTISLLCVDWLRGWSPVAPRIILRRHFVFSAFLGALVLTQWSVFSSLLYAVFYRLFRATESAASTPPAPSAATAVRPGLLGEVLEYPIQWALYAEYAHAVLLLAIGGLAWLIVLISRKQNRVEANILLAASAVCVALIPISVVSVSALNPARPLLLAEFVLVALILTALSTTRVEFQTTGGALNAATSILLCLFVISQVVAPAAAPDYQNTPQYYLESSEVAAANFACQRAPGEVYAEQLLSTTKYLGAGNICTKEMKMTSRRNVDPLYNADFSRSQHPTVIHREGVQTYLGYRNRWALSWDPRTLGHEYGTNYDNGDTVIYTAE